MPEEKIVLKKMQEGDQTAFRFFFERDLERLYLYAMGFMQNREDAEDIVQEAFIALWTNRARLARVDSVQAYLTRTVRNACIDRKLHARVERRYREETAAHREEATREIEEPEALYHRLHAALETLPPKCREIFTLGCLEGLSYREVAEKTGSSVNTVKTQVKIAYKKLREELGEEDALLLLVVSSFFSR
ncbi:MAG: RNA polymerase sigma-70 factor [Odoribacteraceae bacterium]|jgi:RNA polymerase sigma-70 factor (ECF subfamily)|nr:RNA polymerase sigma-70 factor [Odoribacteraceae bacterium]